ncbi:MAG: SAM-dependent methyltransferase [Eubacterium sp.]|nr:SAM-dependent methyltransferase [Eubacterium sp.]
MNLSGRLMTVALAVTPGNRVADIGTDHAYVPIFLVEKGRIPCAIAMDINRGPLEKAALHIREKGLESRISTRLSDGMDNLYAHEADTVIIAGLGGDLMCRILKRGKDLSGQQPELVLQPQSEWFKVRHTLHDLGYQIIREWFLKDEGKYYVVIKAIPGEERYKAETEYVYGSALEENSYPVMREYLMREKSKREGIIEQILTNTGNHKNNRLEELRLELSRIEERLAGLEADPPTETAYEA